MLATLAGCGSVASVSHSLFSQSNTILSGYVGTVVADEPEAALAGRDVLAHGGNAADAATTTALALSVTLPSRASLGGGGACLASRPNEAPHAFLFLPVSAPKADGTRAAAIPMTPRGLFLMQLHYGSVEFADTLAPAIRLARNGITVSRAFGKDLGAVHNALFADEAAQETFTRPDGSVLQNGDSLTQPRLANFLERLGNVGVGDLYNGALAGIFVEGAADAGGGIDTQSLRTALPAEGDALKVSSGTSTAYFLPPPADGGYGAANTIRNGGSAQSAVAMWRASHPATGNTTSLIAQAQSALEQGTSGSGTLPALPASTSFVVTDSHGGAVACALTNNNLFGTGRMAEGTGVLLAASPAAVPQPLLGASIVLDRGMLQGAAASSGQNAAADALAGATRAIMTGSTIPHDGAGRVNATSCTNNRCIGDTDPRGAGLATGSIGN